MESTKKRPLKNKKIIQKDDLKHGYRVQDESPEEYEKGFREQVSKPYFRK